MIRLSSNISKVLSIVIIGLFLVTSIVPSTIGDDTDGVFGSDDHVDKTIENIIVNKTIRVWNDEAENWEYSESITVYNNDIITFHVSIFNPFEDYFITFSGDVFDQFPCNLNYINSSVEGLYDLYPVYETVDLDNKTVNWYNPDPIPPLTFRNFTYKAIASCECGSMMGSNLVTISPSRLVKNLDVEINESNWDDIIFNSDHPSWNGLGNNVSLNVSDDVSVFVICDEEPELSVTKYVKNINSSMLYSNEGVVINLDDPRLVTFKIIVEGNGSFDEVTVVDTLPDGFVFENMIAGPEPDILEDNLITWYLGNKTGVWSVQLLFNTSIDEGICGNVTNLVTVHGVYGDFIAVICDPVPNKQTIIIEVPLLCNESIPLCEPEIELPTESVKMAAELYPSGWEAFFKIYLSEIYGEYDVMNDIYPGWCVKYGTPHSETPIDVFLHSSYDPLLPDHLADENWSNVNYILNHKEGTRVDVQRAILYFINFGNWDWTHQWGPLTGDITQETWNMINKSIEHASDWCPRCRGMINISDTVWINIECPYEYVDGSTVQNTFNRDFRLRPGWNAAQEFTPSHLTISSIELYMTKFALPTGDVTVEICKDSADGIILFTGSISPYDVPSFPTRDWVSIDVGDIAVTPGETYVVVLKDSEGASDWDCLLWSFYRSAPWSSGGPYNDGWFWFQKNFQPYWFPSPDWDFTFRTYGYS